MSKHNGGHITNYSAGYKTCKHDGEAFLKLPCGRLIGGASSRGSYMDDDDVKLLVDCAGDKFRYIEFGLGGKAKGLSKFLYGCNTLELKWSDQRSPEVLPGFWTELINSMTDPNDHLVFACIGGHGRTGTAICSVLIEHCKVNPKEAIKFVREKYCEKAVESREQLEYLYDLGGVLAELPPEEKKTYQSQASAYLYDGRWPDGDDYWPSTGKPKV